MADNWKMEEMQTFLKNILESTGSLNKSYKAVETSLDWKSLLIDGKTVEECKNMYHRLTSSVRKFRTMSEIITDALSNLTQEGVKVNSKLYPDLPKKPLTAYSLFVQKRCKKLQGTKFSDLTSQLSTEWKLMSEEKKNVFKQKYLKKKEKYKEEMQLFYENHPHLKAKEKPKSVSRPVLPQPAKLYAESRLSKVQEKNPEMSHTEAIKKYVSKYEKLSDKRKLKWILKAKNSMAAYRQACLEYNATHPLSNFKPAEFHLTKEELKIFKDHLGKPQPAPKNVFLYFQNKIKQDVAHLQFTERSKEISGLYRQLSEDQLKELSEEYKRVIQDYIDQYNTFYSNLDEEDKKDEESPETALKMYHRLLQPEKPKKKKETKNKNVEQTPSSKKRKLNSEEGIESSKKSKLDPIKETNYHSSDLMSSDISSPSEDEVSLDKTQKFQSPKTTADSFLTPPQKQSNSESFSKSVLSPSSTKKDKHRKSLVF